jgi:pullulanase/glycogen debranching enzyme
MAKSENVRRLLTFLDNLPCNTVAYTVSGEDEKLFVAYNAGSGEVTIDLPEPGEYQVFVNGTQAGTEVLESAAGQVTIPPVSAVVAVNASSC